MSDEPPKAKILKLFKDRPSAVEFMEANPEGDDAPMEGMHIQWDAETGVAVYTDIESFGECILLLEAAKQTLITQHMIEREIEAEENGHINNDDDDDGA